MMEAGLEGWFPVRAWSDVAVGFVSLNILWILVVDGIDIFQVVGACLVVRVLMI